MPEILLMEGAPLNILPDMGFYRSTAAFIIFGVYSFFLSDRILADDRRALTSDECSNLYEHQIKVHIKDGLLSPVISKQKTVLESDRAVQNAFCMKNISYANYKCQLDVRSVISIHECHRIHGGPVDPKIEKALSKKDAENKKNENIPDLESAISKKRIKKVSDTDCMKAYDRLLIVFRDSPHLKNNADKNKMISYWNSEEAKTSFKNRCLRVYRPSDISCVMKGKDRDSLQACLLQVPSE